MGMAVGVGRAKENPFQRNGKALVGKVSGVRDVKESILKAVDLIGGFDKLVEKGEEILVKPNYNSADPPPASTDPSFLRTVVDLLFENGAERVVVGESSWQGVSTRKVMEQTGALEKLKGSGAQIAFFDEEDWVSVDVGGNYLKRVSLARKALEVDKIVYCCCMKTHFRADFSLSLKLAFGFTKKSERIAFHLGHLKEKLVDLNLVVHPTLMLMDGRRCFITGGPFSGKVREPNVIMASGDRIAMDIESIRVMGSFEGAKLKDDPWGYTQIRRATELGLGARSERDYEVVNG